MSSNCYINDLLKSLDLTNGMTKDFIHLPYPYTASCFRYGKDRYGKDTKLFRLFNRCKKT